MDAEKYNELDMQNLEDTCDAAIVPIELVRTVLSDSKRMLAKQREQEKSIHDLTFTAQRQKMKIKELETMCREMYNGSVPDASTESQRDVPVNRLQEIEEKSPVRPGAVRTLSARSSSKRLMKRRSSTIHTESSLGSVGFDQLTDKLRKYTHMQEQNEEFKKVLHATRMISTKKSLDDAVNTIVSSACKLLNCSAVSMYIVEPRNRFYTVTSAIREDPSAEPHILNERTIRTTIAPSIVSRVIVSRNKETISLVSAHTLYSPEIDNPVQIPIDTMMCVPIVDVSGVQVLAVLQALNKFPGLDISQTPEMDNDESFTENDETIMANVAESATNALHALRLNNESKLAQARITGLLHMLQDVAEGTTAYEVIDRIVRGSSREILEAERLSYFSLSLDKQHLILNHSMDAQGIRISINSGVAGYVARTGKDLIIMDAYSDDRFDKSTDEKTGFVTRSIMCMPVRKTENDEVLGVIQAINKVNRGTFDPIDTELLRYIARSAAISMHRSMLHDQLIQAKNFTEARMRISNVSVRNVGIDVVTHVVMDAARLFIDVEATTLFLVDRSKSELWVTGIQGVNSLRIPIGVGLAGKCAQTGEKIVITDAYDDPTFNRSFDLKTGFRTKSVLCVPIMEQRKFQSESEQNAPPENRVVAVFQAINRVHDGRVIAFNDADIKIFDEFCSEVAIVLHQVSMETTCLKIFADSSKSGKDGLAQASLLSMYTASPLSLTDTPGEEVKKRRRGQIFSISSGSGSSNESFDNLSNWESDILALTHREMFSFIQQVFRKYKLYEAFSMPIALLQNFLETVRLKYRDNPFHNFHHGFHCFQSAFLMISSDVIKNAAFLDSLDIFGLLTAALCHGKCPN